MDFTIATYKDLIKTLIKQGFLVQTFSDFILKPAPKAVVLRHDVDLLPQNSLAFARIQAEEGVKCSYYFRFVPESFNESIIKEISALGHEIGYHYETMDNCKGNVDLAYNLFCVNLEKLRNVAPVITVCMHGSPLSKYDNRRLWEKYDYRKLALIGEPYFDVDFNKVLYLTDTGRRWDGESFNIRDKFLNRKGFDETTKTYNDIPNKFHSLSQSLHSTFDIIEAAEADKLPDQMMMTFHPQRWTENPILWMKELVWQNLKNAAKYFVVKLSEK